MESGRQWHPGNVICFRYFEDSAWQVERHEADWSCRRILDLFWDWASSMQKDSPAPLRSHFLFQEKGQMDSCLGMNGLGNRRLAWQELHIGNSWFVPYICHRKRSQHLLPTPNSQEDNSKIGNNRFSQFFLQPPYQGLIKRKLGYFSVANWKNRVNPILPLPTRP